MNPLKKLAGQTAIYGLSSIGGRVINFGLSLYYTSEMKTADFGIYTEMYAYVAFLIVLLTYGMETTFFRFSNKEGYDANKVFSTGFISLLVTSSLFVLLCFIFSDSIAAALNHENNSEYVLYFALIIGLDAVASIPLAKLRRENKAIKFVSVNLANVFVNVAGNIFFFIYCKNVAENGGNAITEAISFDINHLVGYVFIANLICSIVKFLLLSKEMISQKFIFVKSYFKEMIPYALPMMMIGFMGIINETFDRIIFNNLMIPEHGLEFSRSQLGIYGASYKIAMIMTLFVTAFKYAAEPFFFGKDRDGDKKKNLATVFKMLSAVLSVIFLGVVFFQDAVMFYMKPEFRKGDNVVPILLMANLFLGLLVTVSMWYKLTNKTHLGAYLSMGGAIVTVSLNLLLIPHLSYVGCAWTTLICYFLMLVGSIAWGQKHYPINYPLKRSALYIALSVILYLLTISFLKVEGLIEYLIKIVVILSFIGFIYFMERPKKVMI